MSGVLSKRVQLVSTLGERNRLGVGGACCLLKEYGTYREVQ